jgi:hypothetical protein
MQGRDASESNNRLLGRIPSCLVEVSVCLIDQIRPTCVVGGNQLHSKSTDLSVHLIQKTPSQKHQNV